MTIFNFCENNGIQMCRYNYPMELENIESGWFGKEGIDFSPVIN